MNYIFYNLVHKINLSAVKVDSGQILGKGFFCRTHIKSYYFTYQFA